MNRIIKAIVPAALGIAVVLTGVTPAHADDNLTLQKAEITKRIDLRLRALNQFDFTVNHAKHITGDHKGTLHDLITSDVTGLTALKTKVQGETTRDALKADAQSMINDYRVFILVGPKSRLTIVSDTEDAAVARLQQAHDKLADLVAKAKAKGADTSAAEQDLADMQASIDKAKSGIDGQVEKLLGFQPGPDGDAIKAEVGGVRTALKTGRGDLKNAVQEGIQALVLVDLRDTQCGFKAFRQAACQEIFSRQQVEGFAFDVEVLLLAARLGYVVEDLPVEWINSPESHVEIVADSLRMLRDTWQIRRRLRHVRPVPDARIGGIPQNAARAGHEN